MKRSRLLRKTPLRRISKKRAAQRRVYNTRGRAYLRSHPVCEVCKKEPSSQIHHRARCHGRLLTQEENFMAVCITCHRHITDHGQWAKELGYKI